MLRGLCFADVSAPLRDHLADVTLEQKDRATPGEGFKPLTALLSALLLFQTARLLCRLFIYVSSIGIRVRSGLSVRCC